MVAGLMGAMSTGFALQIKNDENNKGLKKNLQAFVINNNSILFGHIVINRLHVIVFL